MATTLPRLTPLRAPQPKLRHLRRERLRLADGERTTLYVARYDLRRFDLRVVRLPRPAPLEVYCRANGFDEALVGGFYQRPGADAAGRAAHRRRRAPPRAVHRAV